MSAVCKFWVVAALCVCCMPVVAYSEDYPFSGAYAMAADNNETAEWREVACLTHFFTQTKTGQYVLYHLDPAELMTNDRLRYVAYESGRCWHDPKSRVDACRVDYNYRNELDPYFVRYESDDFSNTRLVIGDDRASVADPGAGKPGLRTIVQVKCPIPLEGLKSFLPPKRTYYKKVDVDILIGLFGLTPLREFHRRVRAKLNRN
ncbi:MAG: hypothetical protein ACR2O4_15395 [Hyphomicrobiaceae bacterium]